MLDIRIYYGKQGKYAYDSITKPIRLDTKQQLIQIDHLHITSFYETTTDHLVIQSYTGKDIKASTTIKNKGRNIKVNKHTFHISSYINKRNTISSSGDNVLYLPESVYKDYFKTDDEKMLLLEIDNAEDISSVLSQINDIDPSLTIYSNVDLDSLTKINSRMMNSLIMLIAAIFIIMLIILIYHRQKTIDSSKEEYFFLYENGLSYKELRSLARYDYIYYYLIYLSILILISIIITIVLHTQIVLYACLLWLFSLLLEEITSYICIHKI